MSSTYIIEGLNSYTINLANSYGGFGSPGSSAHNNEYDAYRHALIIHRKV